MRCVAYIRVSTKELDENVQMNSIMEFSKSRGIEILEWYIDKKDMWKIMRGDGIDISYSRLKERIRDLKRQGKIVPKIEIKE